MNRSGLGTGKKKGDRAEAGRPWSSHMLKMAEKPQTSNSPKVLFDAPADVAVVDEKRATEWLTQQVNKARIAGVHALVADLTPAIARVLLTLNSHNRAVSKVAVANYSRDIANGNWSLNGQTIVVSRDGDLNDGQHRCLAVIDAELPVPVVFVFGAIRESRFTLDQGKIRTAGDFLGMSGHIDSFALSAAAKYVWQHREAGRLSGQSHFSPTKTEIQSVIAQHPDIADSLAAVPRKGCDNVGGRSMLAFCRWSIAKAASEPVADAFIRALVDGVNLGPRDPILYVRNRLMAERGRISPNEKAELIFRAWNCHRRRETPRTLPALNGALPTLEN